MSLYDVACTCNFGGHNYLPMMITCMDDPAYYLTESEYEKKSKQMLENQNFIV